MSDADQGSTHLTPVEVGNLGIESLVTGVNNPSIEPWSLELVRNMGGTLVRDYIAANQGAPEDLRRVIRSPEFGAYARVSAYAASALAGLWNPLYGGQPRVMTDEKREQLYKDLDHLMRTTAAHLNTSGSSKASWLLSDALMTGKNLERFDGYERFVHVMALGRYRREELAQWMELVTRFSVKGSLSYSDIEGLTKARDVLTTRLEDYSVYDTRFKVAESEHARAHPERPKRVYHTSALKDTVRYWLENTSFNIAIELTDIGGMKIANDESVTPEKLAETIKNVSHKLVLPPKSEPREGDEDQPNEDSSIESSKEFEPDFERVQCIQELVELVMANEDFYKYEGGQEDRGKHIDDLKDIFDGGLLDGDRGQRLANFINSVKASGPQMEMLLSMLGLPISATTIGHSMGDIVINSNMKIQFEGDLIPYKLPDRLELSQYEKLVQRLTRDDPHIYAAIMQINKMIIDGGDDSEWVDGIESALDEVEINGVKKRLINPKRFLLVVPNAGKGGADEFINTPIFPENIRPNPMVMSMISRRRSERVRYTPLELREGYPMPLRFPLTDLPTVSLYPAHLQQLQNDLRNGLSVFPRISDRRDMRAGQVGFNVPARRDGDEKDLLNGAFALPQPLMHLINEVKRIFNDKNLPKWSVLSGIRSEIERYKAQKLVIDGVELPMMSMLTLVGDASGSNYILVLPFNDYSSEEYKGLHVNLADRPSDYVFLKQGDDLDLLMDELEGTSRRNGGEFYSRVEREVPKLEPGEVRTVTQVPERIMMLVRNRWFRFLSGRHKR